MKQFQVASLCAAVALATAPAWGQYGSNGSSGTFHPQNVRSQSSAQYGYANTQGPVLHGAPTAQPAPIGPYQGGMYPGAMPGTSASVSVQPASSAQTSTSLVDQMLDESGCGVDSYGYCAPACSAPAPGCGCGTYGHRAVGGCATSGMGIVPTWYVYANSLVMGRNEPNRLWTTNDTSVPENPVMHTGDIGMPWHGGWEVGIGRFFGCGQWALEGIYWGLASQEGTVCSQSLYGGLVNTPLAVDDIRFGTDPGDPARTILGSDLFNNAEEHVLWRRNEVHNVELNLIRNRLDCGCSSVGCNWSMGVRYFRFEEALSFSTLAGGYDWTDDDGAWSAVLTDRVQNSLVGFQIGCDMNVDLGCNVTLFVAPLVGIYGNNIDHDFRLYRGDGVVAVPDPTTGTYPIQSSDTALSFLSQIDLGVNWAFDWNWEAFLAYRVLFATGIALADHQIPTDVTDIPELAEIDHNGDLVYHGAYLGLTYKF